MAENPNAEVFRRSLEAFSRGDLDTVRALLAEDVVYHFGGANPLAGDHEGKDAVLALFARIVEMSGGTFQILEVHDVLEKDDHVVALLRMTANRQGKQLTWNQANVYHIRRGKIAEAWIMPTDQRAVDEFLS